MLRVKSFGGKAPALAQSKCSSSYPSASELEKPAHLVLQTSLCQEMISI